LRRRVIHEAEGTLIASRPEMGDDHDEVLRLIAEVRIARFRLARLMSRINERQNAMNNWSTGLRERAGAAIRGSQDIILKVQRRRQTVHAIGALTSALLLSS
jgi:hypothetical protein